MNKLLFLCPVLAGTAPNNVQAWAIGPPQRVALKEAVPPLPKHWVAAAAAAVLATSTFAPVASAAIDFEYPQGDGQSLLQQGESLSKTTTLNRAPSAGTDRESATARAKRLEREAEEQSKAEQKAAEEAQKQAKIDARKAADRQKALDAKEAKKALAAKRLEQIGKQPTPTEPQRKAGASNVNSGGYYVPSNN